MKLVDNIINKIGVDKLLHFLVGALIAALFYVYNIKPIFIPIIVVGILAYIKEKFFDNEFSKEDLLYSIGGSIISLIISIPHYL